MSQRKLQVYQYARCSTCRKAVKWLKEQGYDLELHELFDHPPGEEQLTRMIGQSGLEIKRFFNTSGQVYREQNLKDQLPTLTESEQIKRLASNGRLIKRPIVTDGTTVTVGFKVETFEEVWGQH